MCSENKATRSNRNDLTNAKQTLYAKSSLAANTAEPAASASVPGVLLVSVKAMNVGADVGRSVDEVSSGCHDSADGAVLGLSWR